MHGTYLYMVDRTYAAVTSHLLHVSHASLTQPRLVSSPIALLTLPPHILMPPPPTHPTGTTTAAIRVVSMPPPLPPHSPHGYHDCSSEGSQHTPLLQYEAVGSVERA